jgi:hypothetical protein
MFLESYHPTFPVVVFSSSGNLDEQQRALELGVTPLSRI